METVGPVDMEERGLAHEGRFSGLYALNTMSATLPYRDGPPRLKRFSYLFTRSLEQATG